MWLINSWTEYSARDIGRRVFRSKDKALDYYKQCAYNANEGYPDLHVSFNGIGFVLSDAVGLRHCGFEIVEALYDGDL